MKKPKVAIVHDYLIQYGGAEKTLEAILDVFPDAEIFTGIYKPKNISDQINSKKIISGGNSIIGKFPKYLTFLMPFIFENFDLRSYDIIISDGTAWAKGVNTTPTQLHVSYIHTPPRFLYGYSVETQKREKWYFKPFITLIDHYLRVWDFNAAQRPDFLVANSKEVQKRIYKFYKRESTLIHPPVELNTSHVPQNIPITKEKYYVALGRLAKYKNIELLIEAFNLTDMKLVVIGTGNEEHKLKKMAHKNIIFVGHASEDTKKELLDNSLGLIFPVKDEDFGITPIEAHAFGKPVLAHKSGGPVETIQEDINGMFFEELNVESLIKAIKDFDQKISRDKFNKKAIIDSAQKYSKERFEKELYNFVMEKWNNARTT